MNDDSINLGISGLGRAFTLMLPAFTRDPGINLVAAFDPRPAARHCFARDFNGRVYETIEGLAADDDIDAIYIASPHQYHASQVLTAARHGKHVLVEKPIALSLEECDRMIEACKDAGVHLMVGHSHSFDTPYLHARNIIREGEFGRAMMIHCLNYTDFLYRPRRPEELDTDQGGGVIFNQAPHQIDVVRLLADSPLIRVRAVTGAWDLSRPTEGAYASLLWFESGTFATLVYNGYAHFDSDEWCGHISEMGKEKIHGSHAETRKKLGAIDSGKAEMQLKNRRMFGGEDAETDANSQAEPEDIFHQHFGSIIISCKHADIRPLPDSIMIYSDNGCERRELPPPRFPRHEVMDEFRAAIQSGQKLLHDGLWARSTLKACLAILESSRKNTDIELTSDF